MHLILTVINISNVYALNSYKAQMSVISLPKEEKHIRIVQRCIIIKVIYADIHMKIYYKNKAHIIMEGIVL